MTHGFRHGRPAPGALPEQNEATVDIVLTGLVLPGFQRDAVQPALAILLGIRPEKAARLLMGKTTTIRRNLPFDEAVRYLSVLAKAGVDSRIDVISSASRRSVAEIQPSPAESTKATGMADADSRSEAGRRTDEDLLGSSVPPAHLAYRARLANAQQAQAAGPQRVTPVMFGFNTNGRIGRVRFVAFVFYLLVQLLPLLFLGLLLSRIGPALGVMYMVPVGSLFLWLLVRLHILRLHDSNLSGKWLLVPLLIAIAHGIATGSTHDPTGKMIMGGLNLLLFLFMLLWPGSPAENRYGPLCSANSLLVKAAAILAVLLVLAQPVVIPAYQQAIRNIHLNHG